MADTSESQPPHPELFLPLPSPLPSESCHGKPDPSGLSLSVPDPDPQVDNTSTSPKLKLREFVWDEYVIRSVLPHSVIPPWLDPLDVDVDDPTKLPLCWYGIPFRSGLVFRYARRIGVAVYMTRRVLRLKPGDFDAYGTWPRLVEWFERQSGLTMHIKTVWGNPTPIVTFWSNHEMAHISREKWNQVLDLMDDMKYPLEVEPKWYLDQRLKY